MLETRFNRYNSDYCSEKFKTVAPKVIGDEAIVAFDLDEQEFEVYLPVKSGEPDSEAFEMAKDVMKNIAELDNLVQQSNADECKRTGIDAANYDLYLAYVTICKPEIKLCYYGARVNTEWDAIFKKSGLSWEKVNF